MITQTTTSTAGSPVDAVAAALLADVAFALRMARRISSEIRRDAVTRTSIPASLKQDHWKMAGGSVTLGA